MKTALNQMKLWLFSIIPENTTDESFWINDIVNSKNIKHKYLKVDYSNFSQLFDEILDKHDEPFQSSSCIYQYLLRKEVHKHGIKVLLVGEGGDEVLGGYRRFLNPYLQDMETKLDDTSFSKLFLIPLSF